jgi:uroporphyrinogen-III synthase
MAFLILRPVAKYHTSAVHFKAANLPSIGLGLIDTIADQLALAALPAQIAALAPDSLIIFTSTTAAELACQRGIDWPVSTHILAVGQATALRLKDAGLEPEVPRLASTEGLLELARLRAVKGRQVLIVKGQGGRLDLARILSARGARVSAASLYQRISLTPPKATEVWHEAQIQCIIATSGELIEAAFAQFALQWLQSTPWIVVSPRTQKIAAKLGINKILLSENASDQALIHCAKEFLEQ